MNMDVLTQQSTQQKGHAAGANWRNPGAHRSQADTDRLMNQLIELKKKRNAVILSHNYQEGALQDGADFVGDSLGLARSAQETDAEVILFCGVHFMAETAAMICPDKTVLIPNMAAGCSLADMVTAKNIRDWKKKFPDGVVVCYINTSAAVKAECDYCVTSTNGIKVIEQIPKDKDILFVPDFYLGSYLKAKTKRKIHVWKGYCPAHQAILPENIDRLIDDHPEAEFLMHPECGCTTKQMHLADKVLSTEGMVQYVGKSDAKEFIVATETGILHRMQKFYPDKSFYAASEQATCHHMKQNTLENTVLSLLNMQYEVKVDPALAKRAIKPIERMLEIV